MTSNKYIPTYLLGHDYDAPEPLRFLFPVDRIINGVDYYTRQWNVRDKKKNIVYIFSEGRKDFPYMFQGCESVEELVVAVLYVHVKDCSRGVYTKAARMGQVVYSHSMYSRVFKWWNLPDLGSNKFKGYDPKRYK